MAEQVVATEVAEAEFMRFIELMDLDIDPKGWTDDDKKSFDEAKARIVTAIERGHLVVSEKGEPIYTPRLGDTSPITFREPVGASYMEMDQAHKGAAVGGTFKLLGAITQQNVSRFAKMANRDLKVCNAILMLFLGSR